MIHEPPAGCAKFVVQAWARCLGQAISFASMLSSCSDDVTLTAWADSDCGLLKSRVARLLHIPAGEINFGFKVYSMKTSSLDGLHSLVSPLNFAMSHVYIPNDIRSKIQTGLYTTSANII